MNELVSVPISPWYTIPAAVGLLALTFVLAPGVLLHLAVLLYPKGHPRRQEFIAELETVPYFKRPFWVAGSLVRCIFEGTPSRLRRINRPAKFSIIANPDKNFSSQEFTEITRRVARSLRQAGKNGEIVRTLAMAYTSNDGRTWVVSPTEIRYKGKKKATIDGITIVRKKFQARPDPTSASATHEAETEE